ncbi:MAG: hypothetical protein E6Q40_03140 [Cupriavidus sp.]|nr:MAG: hypothetical protein E6Q40_03140 [Cupriavidus sp.]
MGTEAGGKSAGEKGKGRGTGKAEGNYGEGWKARPGRDFLRKQHVAFIVDSSGSMSAVFDKVEQQIQRLSRSNTMLGKLECESGLMVSRTSRRDLQEYIGK